MRAFPLVVVTTLLSSPILAQTGTSTPAPVAQGLAKQAPTPQAPSAAVAVACDNACIRGSADRAVQACAPRVEAEAPGDFEWLTRPYGSIFQQADAPDQPTSPIVRYRGDSIRFLSPQKEWVRAIYECSYDTARQQVASVRVKLGVLGKVAAVPVLPSQARAPQAAPAQAQVAAAQATPAAGAPTSDRRRVGEIDDVSVLQVKPSAKAR